MGGALLRVEAGVFVYHNKYILDVIEDKCAVGCGLPQVCVTGAAADGADTRKKVTVQIPLLPSPFRPGLRRRGFQEAWVSGFTDAVKVMVPVYVPAVVGSFVILK